MAELALELSEPEQQLPHYFKSADLVNPQNPESIAPGYVLRLPDKTYYGKWRDDVVSKSTLAHFAEGTPAHWRYGDPKEVTKAMREGSLIDCLLLEPDQFDSRYLIIPDGTPTQIVDWAQANTDWIPNGSLKKVYDLKADFEAWIAEQHIEVISQAQLDEGYRTVEAVKRNFHARELLESPHGTKQASGIYQDEETGLFIKNRKDIVFFDDDIIIDLKTRPIYKASYWGFRYAIKDFYYDVQDVSYSDAYRYITGRQPEFLFLVVEREAPYLVSWHRIKSHTDRAHARMIFHNWLRQYAECLKRNQWGGYQSHIMEHENIRDTPKPKANFI